MRTTPTALFEDGKKFEAISPRADEPLEIAAFCNNATASRRRGFGLKGGGRPLGNHRGGHPGIGGQGRGYSPGTALVPGAGNPFDSDRKMMTVVGGMGSRHRVFTKGAPDIRLGRCTRYQDERGST